VSSDLSQKADPSNGDGQGIVWDERRRRQFSWFALSTMLGRGQTSQARLNMLGVNGLFQALEFASKGTELGAISLKQTRLKPTVEILDAAIALWPTGRDQERLDPEAQARPP